MKISEIVIPSGARNLLLYRTGKADSSAFGFGMTTDFEMTCKNRSLYNEGRERTWKW
jgi:hypothetical protein